MIHIILELDICLHSPGIYDRDSNGSLVAFIHPLIFSKALRKSVENVAPPPLPVATQSTPMWCRT